MEYRVINFICNFLQVDAYTMLYVESLCIHQYDVN